MLKSIRTKNTMFKKCYKHNATALTEKYKTFANKLTTIKRVAKQSYQGCSRDRLVRDQE